MSILGRKGIEMSDEFAIYCKNYGDIYWNCSISAETFDDFVDLLSEIVTEYDIVHI